MISTHGWAVRSRTSAPEPFDFERRELEPHDVLIDIAFSGICHTDLHMAHDDWGVSSYPLVPGHEIVGVVSRVGSAVTKFSPGDRAGVGTLVDSCRACEACAAGEEIYCSSLVGTYGYIDRTGQRTYGGYSSRIVVDERYALRIPNGLDLAATAPLLCAGITTYSPLRHWGAGPGKKIGVVGLGGLGHMGLKFARAFGAHVVQFTTSERKIEDAKRLGAHEVVLTTKSGWHDKIAGSFDFILDCVSAAHDVTPFIAALKRDGTYCTVGLPAEPMAIPAFALATGRKSVASSGSGGIRETQEMLDFCAEHGVVSDIELTTYDQIASAWERLAKGDVRYRFVLDNASLGAGAAR